VRETRGGGPASTSSNRNRVYPRHGSRGSGTIQEIRKRVRSIKKNHVNPLPSGPRMSPSSPLPGNNKLSSQAARARCSRGITCSLLPDEERERILFSTDSKKKKGEEGERGSVKLEQGGLWNARPHYKKDSALLSRKRGWNKPFTATGPYGLSVGTPFFMGCLV